MMTIVSSAQFTHDPAQGLTDAKIRRAKVLVTVVPRDLQRSLPRLGLVFVLPRNHSHLMKIILLGIYSISVSAEPL